MTSLLFTLQELMLFNGEDRREKYIAYKGVVYDVTDCPKWRMAMHQNLHFPGQDMTSELADAPHWDEVFTRPCVKAIGQLRIEDA